MIVILSIIGIVASISLYEYYSSKNWQQITSSTRNDVVFENRNKEYGAYVIRRDYNKHLAIILASFTIGLSGVYGTFRLTSNDEFKPKEYKTVYDFIPLDLPSNKTVVEVPEIPENNTEISKSTFDFPEPEIVDEELPEQKIEVPVDGKEAGLTGHDGNDGFELGIDKDPDIEFKIIEKPIIDNTEYVFVDEEAIYPGGTNARAKFIVDHINYPQEIVEIGISGACWVKFVIDKKGKVKNASILQGFRDCPECDKEALKVINSMPDWKPGKVNGKEVNSVYKLKINFEAN